MHSYTQVKKLDSAPGGQGWSISAIQVGRPTTYHADKIVLACGTYLNSILRQSFGIQLRLEIWEMTGSYYSVDPGDGDGHQGTEIPSTSMYSCALCNGI